MDKNQSHSGSGDNIFGNKETHISLKISKIIFIIFTSIIIVAFLAIFLYKESLKKLYIDDLFYDLTYYQGNLYSSNSGNNYSQILDKLNELVIYEDNYKYSPSQHTVLANGFSAIHNYKKASLYYKKAYLGFKNRKDIPYIFSIWGSYCYCEAIQNNDLSFFEKEIPFLLELQSPFDNNNVIISAMSMCNAIKSAKNNNYNSLIHNLTKFKENFNVSWYSGINSVRFILNDTLKSNSEYLLLVKELDTKYSEYFHSNTH